MSDPVLVGPTNLAAVRPEYVADLIKDLQAAGFDARLAHDNNMGAGPEIVETVAVWVAESAGDAAIGVAVTLGIQWMGRRFRQSPKNKKAVYIYSYEEDTGQITTIVEMNSPDEEPIIREPHEFEGYTQTRPPERIVRPWWKFWQ